MWYNLLNILVAPSENCEVPNEGSMAPGSNEIPESEVSSQEKPQNADETVDYSCDESVVPSNGLASDALHSNMDKVVNTSTKLGEVFRHQCVRVSRGYTDHHQGRGQQ